MVITNLFHNFFKTFLSPSPILSLSLTPDTSLPPTVAPPITFLRRRPCTTRPPWCSPNSEQLTSARDQRRMALESCKVNPESHGQFALSPSIWPPCRHPSSSFARPNLETPLACHHEADWSRRWPFFSSCKFELQLLRSPPSSRGRTTNHHG